MKQIWLTLLTILTLAVASTQAVSWPSRPIRAIVPYTAGSGTDVTARVILNQLSSELGQSIVVENRVGAGGTIGTAAVAKADPDGYTILVQSSALTITPAIYQNLTYDTERDLVAVAPLGILPNVLIISPSRGIKTVHELVSAAKAKSFTFASAGVGTNTHLSAERFRLRVTLRRLDLAEEIYHLREPEKLALVMSVDEIKRLLAVASSLKARVMFCLGYGCGLRASEVVRLKVKHIDSAQNIIRIEQSKGRKDRNVMLSPKMLDLLRQWWKARPSRYDAQMPVQERWLFPSRKLAGKPMTTRQFNRLFHEAADAAGIKKRVTLHTLRHSFATHLLERQTHIRTIQALLGHTKSDTTARYAHVATGMISAVESPLDQLLRPKKRRRKVERNRKEVQPPA